MPAGEALAGATVKTAANRTFDPEQLDGRCNLAEGGGQPGFVIGSRGFRLKGGINDSLDALGGDRDTTATAWSDMGESVDATFLKASAPLNHRRAADFHMQTA